jgi:hypothetical protein
MIRVVKTKESVRFGSYESAVTFAKKVNGKVNDLSSDPKAKSKFSVTFERVEKPHKGKLFKGENDFHYPNEFWQ